jgi:hypothetical protein
LRIPACTSTLVDKKGDYLVTTNAATQAGPRPLCTLSPRLLSLLLSKKNKLFGLIGGSAFLHTSAKDR